MTNRTHITPVIHPTGEYRPPISEFSTLKHFFHFLELPTGIRSNAVCAVSAMEIQGVIACNAGSTDSVRVRSNSDDPRAQAVGSYYYRTDGTPDHFIDHGAGFPVCAGEVSFTCSAAWADLGTNDFLVLNVGHHLTTGVSGQSVFMGDTSSGSNILNICHGGSNTAYVAVEDTAGNQCTLQPAIRSSGFGFGQHLNEDGGLEPILIATYRRGNTITRRCKLLRTGEEEIDSADCSHFTGTVTPGAKWFWADHVPYGMAVFSFSSLPADVDVACDWMANNWRSRFYKKTAYPGWVSL